MEFCYLFLYHVFSILDVHLFLSFSTFESWWSIDFLLSSWFMSLASDIQSSLFSNKLFYLLWLWNTVLQKFRVLWAHANECFTICFLFLYTFLYKLLLLMLTLISKTVMIVFDIWNSNLLDSCFVLRSFRNLIRSFILPFHVNKIRQ